MMIRLQSFICCLNLYSALSAQSLPYFESNADISVLQEYVTQEFIDSNDIVIIYVKSLGTFETRTVLYKVKEQWYNETTSILYSDYKKEKDKEIKKNVTTVNSEDMDLLFSNWNNQQFLNLSNDSLRGFTVQKNSLITTIDVSHGRYDQFIIFHKNKIKWIKCYAADDNKKFLSQNDTQNSNLNRFLSGRKAFSELFEK